MKSSCVGPEKQLLMFFLIYHLFFICIQAAAPSSKASSKLTQSTYHCMPEHACMDSAQFLKEQLAPAASSR
jgi:hypothetical protein